MSSRMPVPDAAAFDRTSLKVNPCTSFGITLTEPLSRQWAEFAGGCALYEAAYGLSKTIPATR
jgi:long-chain acyl-CoA synthetase